MLLLLLVRIAYACGPFDDRSQVRLEGLDLFPLRLLDLLMLQLSLQERQVLASNLRLAVLYTLSLLHTMMHLEHKPVPETQEPSQVEPAGVTTRQAATRSAQRYIFRRSNRWAQ